MSDARLSSALGAARMIVADYQDQVSLAKRRFREAESELELRQQALGRAQSIVTAIESAKERGL